VQDIVAVDRLRQVHAQAVHVEFLDERGRAADEDVADDFLPVSRGKAGRAVVDVAAVGRGVVGRPALIPVVDVLLRRARVVLPLGARGAEVEVVVANVLDDRDAAAVALAHEVLVLVAAAGARLDGEVMGVAVAPAERTGELRHREQLDRVDAEVGEIRQQIHRVRERPGSGMAGAERIDVQLIDDQLVDATRRRDTWCELVRPELFLGHPWSARVLEIAGDGVDALDKAAALRAIERGRRAGEMPAAGIDTAPADLVARKNIRAVHGLALRVLEPVHIRHALEGGEIGQDRAFPETAGRFGERHDRPRQIDAVAVVGDVAVAACAEDDFDAMRVWRPNGKPQAGRSGRIGEDLARAEPPSVGQIEVLLARLGRRRQLELSESFDGVHVGHFGRNTPGVRRAGRVQPDAPAESRAELGVIQLDRRREAGAPVFGDPGRHRSLAPDL
jgi:hypothetical protein